MSAQILALRPARRTPPRGSMLMCHEEHGVLDRELDMDQLSSRDLLEIARWLARGGTET